MIENLYAKLPPGYILRSSFSVLFGAGGIFMALELRKGDEHFHQKWLMPLVHRLFEPESAHRLGVRAAKMGMFFCSKESRRDFPELHCQLFDRELSSPIGLAAGFDKNGEAIEGLRQHSGFSFIEIGSITPRPQPGNPKPRVFRLIEDQAVINSYGFNSDGLGPVLTRVKAAFDSNSSSSGTTIPLGINLGKNKTTEEAIYDYEIGLTYFAPYSDYLVVNISSPNTPGLRGLQTREELRKLASHLNGALQRLFSGEIPKRRTPKLFVKISPDLSKEELKGIAEICLDRRFGIDGLIIGNTTTSRPERMKCAEMAAALAGGLSGAPLRDLSTKCIREMFALTGGRVPIIGCGGISSGQDAYEKIKAGASAVQLYTALVYEGFPVIGKVKRELAEALKRDGYRNVQEAVGADHRRRP